MELGAHTMGNATPEQARPGTSTRRTLVKGAAWSVPVMAVSAPAAHAGISKCQVEGSIQAGPKVYNNVRAICEDQSQWLNPTTIYQNYGRAYAPAYLEICNCTNSNRWYRWQETDTLGLFQIEVDGVHVDQNSPDAGWRTPFQLPPVGEEGGCKRFNLTYRTADSRPYSANTNSLPPSDSRHDFTINFVLQSRVGTSGPWTTETTVPVTGNAAWRTVRVQRWGRWVDPVHFNSCSPQNNIQSRQSAPAEGAEAPTEDAETEAPAPEAPASNLD